MSAFFLWNFILLTWVVVKGENIIFIISIFKVKFIKQKRHYVCSCTVIFKKKLWLNYKGDCKICILGFVLVLVFGRGSLG